MLRALLVLAAACLVLAGLDPEACEANDDKLQLLQVPARPVSVVPVPRGSATREESHPEEEGHAEEPPGAGSEEVSESEEASEEHSEEGHGEGHSQHGHGEEGHGREVSVALTTTSYLLIGFLVTNFVLLWLVNWPDANVRSCVWKMISAAVSIYLAVLLTNSISDILLEAVRGAALAWSPHMDGKFRDHLEVGTSLCIFIGCFVAGNVLCYRYRRRGKWLYATHTIGGHITAFAGINAFEGLKHHKPSYTTLWVVVLSSAAGLVLIRFCTMKVRRSIFGEPGREAIENEDEQRAYEAFREGISEGEDDACSIITSFMVNELVMASFFAGEGEGHGSHSVADIEKMVIVEGVCLLALVATTYFLKFMDNYVGRGHQSIGYERMVESTRLTVAMIMAWLSLTLFNWISTALYPSLSHEFIEIICAAVLTGSAMLGILVLDALADRFARDPSGSEASNMHDDAHHEDSATPPHLDRKQTVSQIARAELLDSANVENAIRSIIDGTSLAVGLSWEKAFHAAIVTFIKTHTLLSKHKLIAEFGMAMANCFLMLPVWLKFIVPMARKTWQQHQEAMDLDSLHHG